MYQKLIWCRIDFISWNYCC